MAETSRRQMLLEKETRLRGLLSAGRQTFRCKKGRSGRRHRAKYKNTGSCTSSRTARLQALPVPREFWKEWRLLPGLFNRKEFDINGFDKLLTC